MPDAGRIASPAGKTVRELLPGRAAIGRAPSHRCGFRARKWLQTGMSRVDGLEQDHVASIRRGTWIVSRPQLSPLLRDTNMPAVPVLSCVTPPMRMCVRIVRIDRNAADARRNADDLSRGKQLPTFPAVDRAIDADRPHKGPRKVGLAGAAIQRRRIGRIDGERPMFKVACLCHSDAPMLARVIALPDAAARGAGPYRGGLARQADRACHCGRPHWSARPELPLARSRRQRQRGGNTRAFIDQQLDTGFPLWPRCARLKPDRTFLVGGFFFAGVRWAAFFWVPE